MTPQAMGRKEGRTAAAELWNEFLESGDADGLPLSKASAHHLGADRAHALGIEGPGDSEKFISAFAEAVNGALDSKVKSLIPPKLKARIHHFCMLAYWIKRPSASHPEEDAMDHYGLGLHVPGRKLVLHPSSVGSVAARRGRAEAREEWKAFLQRPEPLPARLHWSQNHRDLSAEQSFHKDYEFPETIPYGTPSYGKLLVQWKRAWSTAYRKELGARIKAWIPERIRKLAGHVCALATKLGLHIPKMVSLAPTSGDGP